METTITHTLCKLSRPRPFQILDGKEKKGSVIAHIPEVSFLYDFEHRQM